MAIVKNSHARSKVLHALVVDDDKFMLTVLGDMLGDLGIRSVGNASNAATAIAALGRGAVPDVILCDLNMPGGDGLELLESLAQHQFAGGVIIISGMDARIRNSASLMARFHRLNFLATLEKPVEQAALASALAKLA